MLRITSYLALNATTGTETSSRFKVGGARRIGFLFTRTNHTAGSSTFTVNLGMQPLSTSSPTMVATNMLIDNVTNNNTQTVTRVASKALSSNTSVVVWLDPSCVASFVSVTAATATDGNSTAYILAEYDA